MGQVSNPRITAATPACSSAADAEAILGLKAVLVGFAAANGNCHAPNEGMANVTRGMQTMVRLWHGLAEIGARSVRGD